MNNDDQPTNRPGSRDAIASKKKILSNLSGLLLFFPKVSVNSAQSSNGVTFIQIEHGSRQQFSVLSIVQVWCGLDLNLRYVCV